MEFEKTVIKIGDGSLGFILPANLARYLDLMPGDNVIIKDEKGRKGVYCSFWKKTENEPIENAPNTSE